MSLRLRAENRIGSSLTLFTIERESQRTLIISQRAIKDEFTWNSRNVFNLNINLRGETPVQRYIGIPVATILKYFDREWLGKLGIPFRFLFALLIPEYVVRSAYVAFLARSP